MTSTRASDGVVPAPVEPPPSAEQPAQPHSLRVLVVDDSAMLRRVLQRGVERGGHICMAAGDGVEALEVLDSFKPDVVISDWEMPRMDGPELCRRVRERASDTYPYFIFLTALDQREHILTAMTAGADDYLEKPLDPHALQAALVAASRVTDLHVRLRDQRDEMERLNLRLHGDARRDPLTGLGNRLRLREDLATRLEQAGESGASLAMCDIDFFKRLNDHDGHLAGDGVLEAVAATIRDAVRGGDTIYRYGGEEFLILLPNASLDAAVGAVDRIRLALAERAIVHPDSDVSPFVSLSCGVAYTAPGGGESIQDWIHRADEALYAAKAAGRNRVERSVSPEQSAVA
jgi:two-component system, cell cycle response regulator